MRIEKWYSKYNLMAIIDTLYINIYVTGVASVTGPGEGQNEIKQTNRQSSKTK